MTVPQTIKILREKAYHTDQIGKYGDGNQFMGFVTATLPLPLPEDWQPHKRWYAVLHTFDKKGSTSKPKRGSQARRRAVSARPWRRPRRGSLR